MEQKSITLQEYVDLQISSLKDFNSEREKRYQERFAAQEEAIRVADERLREYKEQANEWRGQSKDREENFQSQTNHETFAKAMDDKFILIQDSINNLNLWKENSQGRLSIITWGVGIGVTVLIGIAIAMITQAIKVH